MLHNYTLVVLYWNTIYTRIFYFSGYMKPHDFFLIILYLTIFCHYSIDDSPVAIFTYVTLF